MGKQATMAQASRLLFSVDEAAELLGLHRSRLFPLIKSRRLQSIKIGRTRRIPASALDAFVARELAEQAGS